MKTGLVMTVIVETKNLLSEAFCIAKVNSVASIAFASYKYSIHFIHLNSPRVKYVVISWSDCTQGLDWGWHLLNT
jgi:hypothetical protein